MKELPSFGYKNDDFKHKWKAIAINAPLIDSY